MISTIGILIILTVVWALAWGFATKTVNESKGYEGGFWWGFWLGFIGLIIIACKPNNCCAQTESEVEMLNLEKLRSYKDLLDSGVITQEEFDIKKSELLKNNLIER